MARSQDNERNCNLDWRGKYLLPFLLRNTGDCPSSFNLFCNNEENDVEGSKHLRSSVLFIAAIIYEKDKV